MTEFDRIFESALQVVKLSDVKEYERLILELKRINESDYHSEVHRQEETIDVLNESDLFKRSLVIISTTSASFSKYIQYKPQTKVIE